MGCIDVSGGTCHPLNRLQGSGTEVCMFALEKMDSVRRIHCSRRSDILRSNEHDGGYYGFGDAGD